MAFTISIGGEERPLDDEQRAELATYLVDVACSRTDFLILSNDETSEYIQCAEAYGRLVAERRDRQGAAFKQCRIVRAGASREKLPPRVAGYEGYEEREVLNVEDVERLFEEFLSGQSVGPGFGAIDVTDEHAEAAQSAEAARAAEAARGDEPMGLLRGLKRLFGG